MEVLLLKPLDDHRWEALVGGKRLREGTRFTIMASSPETELDSDLIPQTIQGRIVEVLTEARRIIAFDDPIQTHLSIFGHIPLPPYIQTSLADEERYQTVYGQSEGSAAAPTAGLHFSSDLLLALKAHGLTIDYVTLHVGLDTFKPVSIEEIEQHPLHSEWANLSPETAKLINETKLAGRKVIAVGTTSVRTLETAAWRSLGVQGSLKEASQPDFLVADACPWQAVVAFDGPTDLYIYPGYPYQVVDQIITNFHLPKSSLLMLVAAFMGLDLMHKAYQIAIAAKYRFYSFGDAMLIL